MNRSGQYEIKLNAKWKRMILPEIIDNFMNKEYWISLTENSKEITGTTTLTINARPFSSGNISHAYNTYDRHSKEKMVIKLDKKLIEDSNNKVDGKNSALNRQDN